MPASDQVLVTYNGALTQDSISVVEAEVEKKIGDAQIPKGPLRKVFFISVEVLQNMLLHGHRNDANDQVNFYILKKNNEHVQVIAANLVENTIVADLKRQIEKINSFDDPAMLKEFYMQHLEKNEMSAKGGAGLGFITIAMKSGNKLAVDFHQINEKYSLFLMTATVNLN